ncbi:MAG: GNAT family N-acetyltransferase [Saprospiraceae bacterium]
MLFSNYIYQDQLQSSRLVTRFLTRDDISIWTDFFKDEEAIELMPTYGLTTHEERATRWIEKQLDRYATHRMGHQALIDKNTNAFIGQSGLLVQEVDGVTELEVGYHVFKKYWGQGYAPEAARLFLNHAFENNLSDSVISIIDTRNLRSQRVADKNGLLREKQTTWSDLNVYIYRIDKSNWK